MARRKHRNLFDEWDEQLDIITPIKKIALDMLKRFAALFDFSLF